MALRWENVQFDQGLAYFVTSKNDDPRTVKLERDLCEEMPAFAGAATQGPIFPFRCGGGLEDRLVRAKLAVYGIKPKPRKRTETKAASPVVGRLPYVLPHVGNLDAALRRR